MKETNPFRFSDEATTDKSVFSFFPETGTGHGYQEVLAAYKKLVPTVKLGGPVSFAPIINSMFA